MLLRLDRSVPRAISGIAILSSYALIVAAIFAGYSGKMELYASLLSAGTASMGTIVGYYLKDRSSRDVV
jgi:zinc transporter ZupT